MKIPSFLINIWITILAFKNLIFLVFYATILATIPIMIPCKAAKGAYILLLMTGLWMTEAIPIYVTALFPVFLGPLLGISPASIIATAYMKDTNMLFIGSLFMACALETNNLHKRIAISILKVVGSDPKMLMFGFMIPSWFLSMWMSNTATTALMITIVDAMLDNLNSSENETMFGEHTNSTTKEQSNSIDFLKNGGKTHFIIVEPSTNLPNYDINKIKEIRKLNIAFSLCVSYASTCGGIATITGTPPNSILYGIINSRYGHLTGLNFGTWMAYAFPISVVMFLIAWIWLIIVFIGPRKMFKFTQSESRKQFMARLIEDEQKKIGRFTYAEGLCCVLFGLLTILWITRSIGNKGWGTLLYDSNDPNSKIYLSDSVPAVFISVLAMILPASNPLEIWRHRKESYKEHLEPEVTINRNLLSWSFAQRKFPWGVLIIVGGGFALADICELSGLSSEVGKFLGLHFSAVPVSLLAVVFTFTAAILTEFASNAATASIILPIVFSLSENLNIHPFLLAFPTTIGTSLAFSLPASTPSNAIVFSKGRIRVKDMLRSGILLNIMGSMVSTLITITYAKLLFNFNTQPEWAIKGFHNLTVNATINV